METTMTQEQKTLYGLDCIAEIAYFSSISIAYLDVVLKFIPQSSVKDAVLFWQETQKRWLDKTMRAARHFSMKNNIPLYDDLKSDIEGDGLLALFECIKVLKKTRDLESVSDILEESSGLIEMSPTLKTQIIALIRNEKNKAA